MAHDGIISAVSRRAFMRLGLVGSLGAWVGSRAWAAKHQAIAHNGMTTVGEVDHERNGFEPHAVLSDWDGGRVSRLPDGRRLREYEIVAVDREIEIAPSLFFPAWTYAGRVPGPTLRATEGDVVRIVFRNRGSHPHTLHFHGIHPARMDGVPGAGEIYPGGRFTYEFEALPFGCHLYHCHSVPLKRHIHKGYMAPSLWTRPRRGIRNMSRSRARGCGVPRRMTAGRKW